MIKLPKRCKDNTSGREIADVLNELALFEDCISYTDITKHVDHDLEIANKFIKEHYGSVEEYRKKMEPYLIKLKRQMEVLSSSSSPIKIYKSSKEVKIDNIEMNIN